MATVSLQRAVADLPATRARRNGGKADPGARGSSGAAAGPCPPQRRARRAEPCGARLQPKFHRPSKLLQNRRQPLKNSVPRTDKCHPSGTRHRGAEPPPSAEQRCAPARRGAAPPAAHASPLFSCSRALPTCRAGGTPPAPPPSGAPSKNLLAPAGTGVAHTGTELQERQDAIAARSTSPTFATSRTGPGAARGRPHAATCATDSTCPASPRPHGPLLGSVHGLRLPRNYQ